MPDRQLVEAPSQGLFRANQIVALIVEWSGNLLLQQYLFQQANIPFHTVVYLANDLLQTLQDRSENSFSLLDEISILYKKLQGQPLSESEKNYDDQIHHLDLLAELKNALQMTLGFSFLQSFVSGINIIFQQALWMHLPALFGSTALLAVGPRMIQRLVEKQLAKSTLSSEQQAILKPWLIGFGRLLINVAPKVKAEKESLHYQYPSTNGYHEIYSKVSVTLHDEKASPLSIASSEKTIEAETASESLPFTITQVLSEKDQSFSLKGFYNGDAFQIQFLLLEQQGQNTFEVTCKESTLVQSYCEKTLSKLFPNFSLHAKYDATIENALVPVQSPMDAMAKAGMFFSPMMRSTLSLPVCLMSSLLFSASQSIAVAASLYDSRITKRVAPLQAIEASHAKDIPVVVLKGSPFEMGLAYGAQMRETLHRALSILKNYFMEQHNVSYEKMLEHAQLFYDRYSHTFKQFLVGEALASGLSLEDCKILLAMETLNSLANPTQRELSACAYVYLPPEKTTIGGGLIGRNYDFPAPFDQMAELLTVTVFHVPGKVPTAAISLPGQIYCPSCVNANGLFLELNNGMPSGGSATEQTRESTLIRMLYFLQDSSTSEELYKKLYASQSDYSLILNVGNVNETNSFEFSSNSTLGLKSFTPSSDQTFVSTNFYQNTTWVDIPEPTDEKTWQGVTRYNHLQHLLNAKDKWDLSGFKNVMETSINTGGAVWDETIYQIIFNPKTLELYLRKTKTQQEWTKIPLDRYFKQDRTLEPNKPTFFSPIQPFLQIDSPEPFFAKRRASF